MSERVFVDTNAIEWEDGLDVVSAMAPDFQSNLGPLDLIEDLYVKYHQKTLRIDPTTTRRIDLIRLDAGYRDLTNAYHDSVEECLVLTGEFSLDGEGDFAAGDYFWRPPGFVHAAETSTGFTGLLGLQGLDPAEGSDYTSRRIRPDEEAGTNQLYDDAEVAVGPRGWVRNVDTRLLPWIPGPVYARGQGAFDGMDLQSMAVKVLSHNLWTGGQTLLVRLDPGYAQTGRGNYTADVEQYVVEGSCAIGEENHAAGAYLFRPAGAVEAPMTSHEGGTLYVKINAWWDRQKA